MKHQSEYFQFIEKSRRRIRPGDFFCAHLKRGPFTFGRVILTNAEVGLEEGDAPVGVLVYVYDVVSDSPAVDMSLLRKGRLLLTPVIINRTGWLDGYFFTIHHQPLKAEDHFARHCFLTSLRTAPYRDERSTVYWEPFNPCGVWGVHSYDAIGEDIVEALGLR